LVAVPGRDRYGCDAASTGACRAEAESSEHPRCCSATAKAPGNDGLRYAWSEVRRQPMAPALQRV